tara:strand:- start:4791 stop:5639 length:849 start_codon:yes stop_codon:yes gene_type:complete
MDLYGYSAGAASANQSRGRVAEGNQAVSDFNKGLASQKDLLEATQKGDAELRQASAQTKEGAGIANLAAKASLKGTAAVSTVMAAKSAAKAAAADSGVFVPSKAGLFSRVEKPAATAVEGVQSSADVARGGTEAAEVGTDVVRGGTEVAEVASSGLAKGAGALAKGLGVLGGAATVGLEGYKIATSATSFKDENWKQEVGQISSLVGGGMQIAGALGAWIPGVGLGLELVGTGLAVGGSVLEDAGDTDAEKVVNEKDDADIDSQKRTMSVAQSSGVEVSRSE